MSASELKKTISKKIKYLRKCKNLTSEEAGDAFKTLVDIANSILNKQNEKVIVAQHVAGEGYGQLFVNMWKSLSEFLGQQHSKGIVNLHFMVSSYAAITDISSQVAAELGKSGGISLIVEALDNCREIYSTMSLIINNLIIVLANSIQYCSDNLGIYRKTNIVPTLKKYLDCDDMVVKVRSLRILAFVVDEEESGVLQTVNDGVAFLVAMIKDAVKSDDHREHRVANSRSSALEILQGLNKLAVNDANKEEIERQGGIPVFIRMLQDDFSDEEHLAAVEALWNLAFVESIRQSNELQASVKLLAKLLKSSNQHLRDICEYAIWQIQGRNRESIQTTPQDLSPSCPSYDEAISQPDKTTPGTAQLMISYQWDNQKEIIKIRDYLTKVGYKVWMDVTHMRGSILSAMADAVEKSAVVLVCMSEKYKNSQSCRAEAEYAYKLQKPIIPLLMEVEYKPDGWLGVLLGMKLYHKCNSANQVDMTALLNDIGKCMSFGSGSDAVAEPTTMSKQSEAESTPSSQEQPQSAVSVRDWTEKDVQAWLQQNKIPELCETLDFCDGDQIKELYDQYCRDPGKFQNDMESEYQMSHRAHLKFVGALKKLFRN